MPMTTTCTAQMAKGEMEMLSSAFQLLEAARDDVGIPAVPSLRLFASSLQESTETFSAFVFSVAESSS